MNKYIFILLCFISSAVFERCQAQDISQGVYSGKKGNKPPVKPPKPKPKPPITTGTLRVTANEDCTVQINDKNYIIKKGTTKNIPLVYGVYKLIAVNTNTFDQYRTDIIIKEAKSLVQVDFTSIIAERKRTADSLENAKRNTARINSVPSNPERPAQTESANSSKTLVSLFLSNMVPVAGGSFVMGYNLGDNDEEPAHTVNIKGVQFSRYEVTQQQWESLMGANPSAHQACKDCPVENISFDDVQLFLEKINQQGAVSFRLPTEAEWEYVASKGADTKNIKEKAWYKFNAEGATHAVGTKAPNGLGIYDMAGNVAEWCSDWYAVSYYKKKTADNPAGPGAGKTKVVRGGSFEDSENTLRRSYRDKQATSFKKGTIGLRLVTEAK